jgi:hypothetical protein
MVLQIRETMVLQKVELEGKGITSHFCVFGSFVALMGKHGFAEKLHLQLKWSPDEMRSSQRRLKEATWDVAPLYLLKVNHSATPPNWGRSQGKDRVN